MMEKITSTYSQSKEENVSHSTSRRETRKRLEQGASENSSDRLLLNNIMLAIMVIIASVISFTDFSLSFGEIKKLTALAIFLYIITSLVYQNRYNRGKIRGKTDVEYKESLREYREKRKGVYDRSAAHLVPEFCRYYKAHELQEYRESLLSDVEIEYSEYKEKYRKLPFLNILLLKLPFDMKKVIIKCNRAKPIKLTAGLILNENGEADRENLIGQSGKVRERKDKRRQQISRAISVLFGAAVVVNLIFDFSVVTIIQWCVRMLPIIAAIPMGDDAGYCNITVTETAFKKSQTHVINLFNEYLLRRKDPPEKEEDLTTQTSSDNLCEHGDSRPPDSVSDVAQSACS